MAVVQRGPGIVRGAGRHTRQARRAGRGAAFGSVGGRGAVPAVLHGGRAGGRRGDRADGEGVCGRDVGPGAGRGARPPQRHGSGRPGVLADGVVRRRRAGQRRGRLVGRVGGYGGLAPAGAGELGGPARDGRPQRGDSRPGGLGGGASPRDGLRGPVAVGPDRGGRRAPAVRAGRGRLPAPDAGAAPRCGDGGPRRDRGGVRVAGGRRRVVRAPPAHRGGPHRDADRRPRLRGGVAVAGCLEGARRRRDVVGGGCFGRAVGVADRR